MALDDTIYRDGSGSDRKPNVVEHAARSSSTTGLPRSVIAMIVTLAFSETLVAISATAAIPLIPKMSESFGASGAATAWIAIISPLMGGVVTPVMGRLGDAIGYRKLLVAAFGLLCVGTLLCAVSTSLAMFLGGRALQGFVIGTMPAVVGILRNHLEPKAVGSALGIVVAGQGFGVGVGFILGGMLQDFDWSVTFWVVLGLAVLALIALVTTLPGSISEHTGGRLDLVGAAVFSCFCLALLLPLSMGSTWGWSSPTTLGLFVLAAVALPLWAVWELRHPEPTVDVRLFSNPFFVLPNIAGFMMGASVGALFLLFVGYASLPREVAGFGFSASILEAGSFLVPYAMCVMIGGLFVGRFASRRGPRFMLLVGSVLTAVTYLVLTVAHIEQWQIYLASAIIGFGGAASNTGMYLMVAQTVSPDRAGMAQGVNSLVFALGSASGSAAIAAILTAHTNSLPFSDDRGYGVSYALCFVFGLLAAGSTVLHGFLARRRGAVELPLSS
ncbi:Antiseptic resistance protein [Rhodococcus fascians]|uniref:MFS transporter n=1 Tax=Nocardiaceae TaxID=85025 RepID=UPI00117B9DC0|nr:MFS transporter [Rhodococcus sp. 06-221-2]NIL87608.1 Antiseptic resistance protein [Rhodococcus fascians]NIL92711.1 Antiseptic resistance protein [Rhodococcus fascians]